jgi:alpha-amylase/alpha-mannosidase (GH57 family)
MNPDSRGRLPVVLLWHMHQPHYRDALTGEYALPWTYLHGLKDYSDMAAHLEANPAARAVINVTPVLIEQLNDYVGMLRRHLEKGEPVGDAVLALLTEQALPEAPAARVGALRACLRAQKPRMIERFPAYLALATIAESFGDELQAGYASDALLRDIAVWYHLAWCGEVLRRDSLVVRRLMAKERDFDAADRRMLLTLIADTLAGILPRWRRLAESGQVELSVTPYSHPILPLLQDFGAARESQPDLPLPQTSGYSGGGERAAWHVDEAIRRFTAEFGFPPKGCWPAEGAISRATLELLDTRGFEWAASGANVLRASLAASHSELGEAGFDQPWRLRAARLHCFFRSDRLSDLVGFQYSDWHGDDAAAHLDHELTKLADLYRGDTGRCVLIALDGENAWEHYPDNGYWFLDALYRRLADNPRLELTTLSAASERAVVPAVLTQVVAGSWVHGTLSTWMGDADKNQAWELLCAAKSRFDSVRASGRQSAEQLAAAEHQLAQCESSDWFWWFGGYNPAEAVASFDQLYRRQLTALYRLLDEEPPAVLEQPLSRGGGAAEGGGSMRRADG